MKYRDSEWVYTIALVVIAAPIGAHQGEHFKVEAEHANICANLLSKKKDKKHFLGLFFTIAALLDSEGERWGVC